MRVAALVLGSAIAASSISIAPAAVRIKADPGGQIGPYLENLVALEARASGSSSTGHACRRAPWCSA